MNEKDSLTVTLSVRITTSFRRFFFVFHLKYYLWLCLVLTAYSSWSAVLILVFKKIAAHKVSRTRWEKNVYLSNAFLLCAVLWHNRMFYLYKEQCRL